MFLSIKTGNDTIRRACESDRTRREQRSSSNTLPSRPVLLSGTNERRSVISDDLSITKQQHRHLSSPTAVNQSTRHLQNSEYISSFYSNADKTDRSHCRRYSANSHPMYTYFEDDGNDVVSSQRVFTDSHKKSAKVEFDYECRQMDNNSAPRCSTLTLYDDGKLDVGNKAFVANFHESVLRETHRKEMG